MTDYKVSPYKAVDFKESAIEKALETSGYLIADTKHDGVRGDICVDNTSECVWLSRVSKPIPALEYLNGFDKRWERVLKDDRCIFPDGFMLDGELMVKGVDFNTGSGLLRTKWCKQDNVAFLDDIPFVEAIDMFGKVRKNHPFQLGQQHLKVVLYAVLPLHIVESGEDYEVKNLLMAFHTEQMVTLLKEHFPEIEWELSEAYDVYSMVELNELYEQKREAGHEGLVVKDPNGIYRRGKKTGWWKMKPENEADGTVCGLVWGTPGKANEGKVIGFEVLLENGRVVNATNISQSLMDEFTGHVLTWSGYETQESYQNNRCDAGPYEGWQVQIRYMEETPDGSLRHPSFDKWRGTEEDPTVKM